MTSNNRYEINDEIYIDDLLTEEDIPSFVKYLNNPTIHANTLAVPYPYTTKDGEEFLETKKTQSTDSEKYFSIRLNTNDELIGACAIIRLPPHNRRAEIGYWLAEPYWHRGLMSKVAKKVIDIAKNDWENLVRIEAGIFHWNDGSKRVVEKCGFQFEGILRKYIYKDGKDLDIHSYALIFD